MGTYLDDERAFENRMAADDEHDAWVAVGCPESNEDE